MSRTLVIGSGLAGLTAALLLEEAGTDVTLVTMGFGGLQLSPGTIDILGYAPDRVAAPLEAVAACVDPHPYARIGAEATRAGVTWLQDLLPDLVQGSPERNVILPSVVGAMRPTACYPTHQRAGLLRDGVDLTIVGLRHHKDFYPELIAGNLERATTPDGGNVRVHSAWIDVPARDGEADSSALTYARFLDTDRGLQALAGALDKVPGTGAIGLPAILGLKRPDVPARLAEMVGREVFEIPGLPPSVPGMRLNEALRAECLKRRIRLIQGAKAVGFEAQDGHIQAIRTHAAGRDITYPCDTVVYAPGGFESGALTVASTGAVSETLFGLPLYKPAGILVHGDYWGKEQPLFEVGVRVDAQMRPVDEAGEPAYHNLVAAGSLLGGAGRWHELSGEGIALGSAWAAVSSIKEER